jgi:hypothetical protein
MRFQTDLVAPSDSPATALFEPCFVSTAETRAWAATVAVRLRAEGFAVQEGESLEEYDQDDDEAPDAAEVAAALGPERAAGLDVTVVQELRIDSPAAPMSFVLQLYPNGGYAPVDASYRASAQPFWAAALRVLTVVREVTGFVAQSAGYLERCAAGYGVRPDGSIARLAELTDAEVDAAVAAVLDAIPADYLAPARARTGDPESEELLRALAEELAACCPEPKSARFPLVFHTSNGSIGLLGGGDQALIDTMFRVGGELWHSLGSVRTGRAAALIVRHRPDAAPLYRVEAVYDRIPVRSEYGLGVSWEPQVRGMLLRDPEWQPEWLPEVVALLERGGAVPEALNAPADRPR